MIAKPKPKKRRKIRTTKQDIEWAQLIKERDKWTCQRCQKRYPQKSRGLHAAHIFSRRFKRTRHDPEAGLALCWGCHSWAHSNPLEAHEFFSELLGDERCEALKERAKRLKI
jgi:hypothetical protein